MRTPKLWKRFLDPKSGNGVSVLKRKSNIFVFLWENCRFLKTCASLICRAHVNNNSVYFSKTFDSTRQQIFSCFWGSWLAKITLCQNRIPRTFLPRFKAKIAFLRLFASIYRPSLNQGSVFSLRKCQIWIPRMVASNLSELTPLESGIDCDQPWKCFPSSGKEVGVLKRKWKNLDFRRKPAI